MHSSKKLILSKQKAKKVAQKSNRRAIKWGMAWENIYDTIPQSQWAVNLSFRRGTRIKEEVVKQTEIKAQNDAYKMIVQETIDKAIKEFRIIQKPQKEAINKLAHLMAKATVAGDHQKARQVRALIGIEVLKATKDKEKSLRFLAYLDWAIQSNWATVEKERQKLDPLNE